MLPILTCIEGQHDAPLVILAAIVCVLAACGTVRLCRQLRWATGRAKALWLIMAGSIAGLGIWATHFIAMLGYDPGFIIGYHFDQTATSLILVVGTAIVGLIVGELIASSFGGLAAASLVGGGIAGMHYLGMAALDMPAIIHWKTGYVVASILFAILPMVYAIPLALRGKSWGSAAAAVALITFGVIGLHFTGMTAIVLVPSRTAFAASSILSPRAMSFCVFLAVSCTIAITAGTAMVSRRTAVTVGRHERASRLRVEAMKSQLDLALENMHQGLCLYDAHGRLTLWNQRFLDMYELTAGQIRAGLTVQEVAALVLEKHASADELPWRLAKREQDLEAALADDNYPPMIYEYQTFTISLRTRRLPDGGWVSTFDDITQQRKAEERIRHLASHDELTGLPNRRRFHEIVNQGVTVAALSGIKFGLVVIDLDHFNDINDSHGYDVGDVALKGIAQRLLLLTSDQKQAARLGGDEFGGTILYREDHELEEFVCQIAALFGTDACFQDDVIIHGSIGVATYPADGLDGKQLYNNADLAMHRAKAAMGEQICYYEKGMDEIARQRRQLTADLRGAVTRGEMAVLYQPQLSLKDDTLSGYEALVRWRHPTRGLVSPVDFIPIAEETGDILAIGEWVLREACMEAMLWPGEETVAVNLSTVQLSQRELPEIIAQILLDTHLPARRLELEMTETAIISDKACALHNLRRLKGMGISIAIDDFGTGHSSLDTLNSFPFDKIKIDKSFVFGAEERPQAHAIIRAIIALGRSLGMMVLAEGVETTIQSALLRSEGCDQAQGYLYGCPQAAPSLSGSQAPSGSQAL